MRRKLNALIVVCVCLCMSICSIDAFAAEANPEQIKSLNIATAENRPLSIDRLVYTAFMDIGYKVSHIPVASLQAGYQLANNDERDGVVSSTPNMEQIYPNLIKVPVVLENNDCNVYVRAGSDIKITKWQDLSGLRVGMLSQRVYIENQTPDDAVKIPKGTTKLLFDGLLRGEYDVAVLSVRAHETLNLPEGIVYNATVDPLTEYLYLHKKHKELIPSIAESLEKLLVDGRGEKILNDIPIPKMYSKKTVLHIISSNTEISREDQFSKAIMENFQDDTSVEWYSVALNSKHFSDDPQRLSYFANLLRRDCASRNIAAIVVSGEEAFNFVKDHYYLFFRNTPVLFYGLTEGYETAVQGYEQYFTGVVERLSAYETVSAALNIFPNTQTVYVVNDYTAEGMNYRAAIEKQLEQLPGSLRIEYNDNVSRDDMLTQIKELPWNSIVLVGSYFCDADGQYYSLNEMKRIMEYGSLVPVFSMYSTDLAYGAIGGKCLNYAKYGEVIAGSLERLLAGESITNIPVVTDSEWYNTWIFDKAVMTSWKVNEKKLPSGSVIINRTPSVWEAHPALSFGMLFFTVASIFAIICLLVFSRKLRKKNADLLEIEKHLHTAEEMLEKDNKIKEIKERLEWIVHTAPIGYMMSVCGTIVEINENMEKFIGLKCGDVIREAYARIDSLGSIVERVTNRGIVDNEVTEVYFTNGEKHRCIVSMACFKYNDQPATVVWVTDIEESERQKDKLLESRHETRVVQERLERTIRNAPIAYLLAIDNIIIELNENMQKDTGLSVGSDIRFIYDDPAEHDVLIAQISERNHLTNAIIKIRLSDGEIHRCLINATTVEYEQKHGIAVWALDMEESEKQKDRLQAAHQSLQNVLDTLPIPTRIVDVEDGDIIYVNEDFLKLLEYASPDDLCGRKFSVLFPSVQSSGLDSAEMASSIVDSVEPLSTEVEYISATGKIVQAMLITRHINYNGRSASIGIARDLAKELREAELRAAALAAEDASRAKTDFLANMSHEIRTPMNGIVGFTELALDEESTVETKNDYLEKIKESSGVLLNIINDILDISKIEAGKMELENIPFDMHDIFAVCRTIIESRASEKGIELYCYAEPSVGKKLLGDPVRVRQILLNLLSNAVKFTNVGVVKLLSAIEETSDDSVTMQFEVKDSGIGMSPEQIANIFEPFMQADVSTTRRYGGTGLGLSISKRLIELMGGTLSVESAVGLGSKFSFALTFKTMDSPADIPDSKTTDSNFEKPVFKAEVLVCEDNETNQHVIRDHLSRVGIKAVIADNGQKGVEHVRMRMENGEKPFDLIFMDIHMPVMDGLEAADELHRIGNKAPVVALTANVMANEKAEYRLHAMQDYLAKPFTTLALWACLMKHLTPVSLNMIRKDEYDKADAKRHKRLLTDFVRDNQTTYKDINSALDAGDIKLAHRLVHTLKGLAGLMDKKPLRGAAAAVEDSLKDGKAEFTQEQMDTLERELSAVLDELAPLLDTQPQSSEPRHLDKEKAARLFDKLEPLLESDSIECLELTDELKEIPETDALIKYMEDYEYEPALAALAEIRTLLGV